MQSQRLLSIVALTALMIVPAAAQTASQNTQANKGQTTQTQPLPQEIKQKLEKQGFSNVQVVPGSFLVSAKDKDGDPVNMVIGPNSMMVITSSPVSANTGSSNNSSTHK